MVFSRNLTFIYGPQIIERVVPRIGSLGSWGYRGATSLAPEPGYYATVCAAFLVLNEIFYKEKRYGAKVYIVLLFILILILQIILSHSGTGLLFLSLFLASKALSVFWGGESGRKILSVFSLCLIAVCLDLLMFHSMFQKTRAGYIISQLMEDPIGLWQEQRSISTRLGNLVLVLYGGFIKTYGLGFGLARTGQENIPDWLVPVLGIERSWGGRTMGGLLSSIYELGIAGAIFVTAVWWIVIFSILKNYRMRSALFVSAVTFLLPRQIFESIAFPLFGYLVGIHLFYYRTAPLNHSKRRLRNVVWN